MGDDTGLVLHMQHGGNLSKTHAHTIVTRTEIWQTPLAHTPGFAWYCTAFPNRPHESPYVTTGAACFAGPLPSECKGCTYLRKQLHSCGVVTFSTVDAEASWNDTGDSLALLTMYITHIDECFFELGRHFSAVNRFPDTAVLPCDVARSHEVERLALLHVARMLLRRTAGRSPHWYCRGQLRMQLRALPTLSV